MEIARSLVALGVNKLICGGIQSHYKDWLISKGITVVDNQRGVAKEIVCQLLKDCGTKGAVRIRNRST
jgi:predicted Fe-Mo cluster-binding NifX family protein